MLLQDNMCNFAFVDIQGFKHKNNKFMLKEVYIHTELDNVNYHALIDSPHSFCQLSKKDQRQVTWLTKNFHGIGWNDGDISFIQFLNDVSFFLRGKTIMCKGFEKMQWLKDIFKEIHIERYVNCEDLGLNFKLHNTNQDFDCIDICANHKEIDKKNHYVCAMKNVMSLKRLYFEKEIK